MSAPAPEPSASIDALPDGARVRLTGVIRAAAPALLRARLSERACVYWDVRHGLDDAAPHERAGQPFWLECAGGRVLVRGEALCVDARPERRATVLAAVEQDMVAVEGRLVEIKALRRTVGGEEASALMREQKRLAKVATLLCAIRAHARGRVHGNRGTLVTQERWIRENMHLAQPGDSVKATELMVQRWETALEPGQEVQVEGVLQREPAPPELMRGASYRASATVAVLVGTSAAGVRLTGVGASAPLTADERRELARPRNRSATKRGRGSRMGAGALVVGGAIAVAVATLLGYLGR